MDVAGSGSTPPLGRATIKTLAETLNVSISTISRALSNHGDISEETKTRVFQLAQKVGYQHNQLAAGLRKGRSNTIGVIIPHIKGSFYSSVVDGIETKASEAGFNVMICQSNDDTHREELNVGKLLNAQVDGILVSLAQNTLTYDHFEKVRSRALPLVFFDRCLYAGPAVHAVVLDDYRGAYKIVEHLLAQGNRRIAYLGGPTHLNVWHNRYQGYLDALRDGGLPVDPALVRHCNSMNALAVRTHMRALSASSAVPDAIFAASGLAAAEVMQCLQERGLGVPQDIAVAGFHADFFAGPSASILTAVDPQCEEMGRAAVQVLLNLLTVPMPATVPTRQLLPQPKLSIRDSSRLQRLLVSTE